MSPVSSTGPQRILSSAAGGPLLAFPLDEYEARWGRVYAALERRGLSTAVVWGRSGGSYDRAGDLHWLCNYASLAAGQETTVLGIGVAYGALVFRNGEEPELHVLEALDEIDEGNVATGRLVSHASHGNLPAGLARHLIARGVTGRVWHNGDDLLPMLFAREFAAAAPDIELEEDLFLMYEVERIKTPREQDALRTATKITSDALTAVMSGLVEGKSGAAAAADAAAIIVGSGGGFQRIGTGYGPNVDRVFWRESLHGYALDAPEPGQIVRGWIYGPAHKGYWVDPGRTAVAGGEPTPEQRSLIEASVDVADAILAEVKPGMTASEVGLIGDRLVHEASDESAGEYAPTTFGHGVGSDLAFWPIIPSRAGRERFKAYDDVFEPGMTTTCEIFLSRKGVGLAAIERVALITDTGTEVLDTTPTVWW